MRYALAPFLLAAAALAAADPYAGVPVEVGGPSWYAVDHFVVSRLLERPRGPWVDEVLAEPLPQETGELLLRFDLLLRDGRREEAQATLDALAERGWPALQWSMLAEELIDREDDELARHVLERVPTATPGWGYVLVNRWAGVRNGAIIESKWRKAERWVMEREAAARAAERGAEHGPWQQSASDYWFQVRVQLRQRVDGVAELLAELEQAVRAAPADVGTAIRYVSLTAAVDPPADPAWLRDVLQAPGAYDRLRLGEALDSAWPAEAAAWLERSLAAPFGEADRAAMERLMAMRQAAALGPEERDLERMLRLRTKLALAEAYKGSGQHEKAQPLVEELAKDPLAGYAAIAATAGQVQAATGARVVEAVVVSDEAERGDEPDYWMDRGRYFEGRGELEQAEAAFRKAIEVTREDEPRRGKDPTVYRSQAVWNLARFLWAHERQPDAEALLWAEFEAADPAGEAPAQLLNHLDFFHKDNRPVLRPGDERLWRYLAARPTWGHAEERLLRQFAEQTEGDARALLWARAERLVGEEPTRAYTVGWVMTRFDADQRAVPLLQLALAKAGDAEQRQRAAFVLYEAALALSDPALIAAQWPEARRRLGPREVPEWLEKMAEAAAQAGDAQAAERWGQVRANLDRRFE